MDLSTNIVIKRTWILAWTLKTSIVLVFFSSTSTIGRTHTFAISIWIFSINRISCFKSRSQDILSQHVAQHYIAFESNSTPMVKIYQLIIYGANMLMKVEEILTLSMREKTYSLTGCNIAKCDVSPPPHIDSRRCLIMIMVVMCVCTLWWSKNDQLHFA